MSQSLAVAPSKGMPKGVLLGAAALTFFALSAVAFSRVSEIGAVHMAPVKPVAVLSLKFADRDDGSVGVIDASTEKTIYVVAPGTNGFIRGVMRGLIQERKRSGLDDTTPFTLTHWADGTVSLEDSAIHRAVDLDAFGPTNSGAFAQLFADAEAAK